MQLLESCKYILLFFNEQNRVDLLFYNLSTIINNTYKTVMTQMIEILLAHS